MTAASVLSVCLTGAVQAAVLVAAIESLLRVIPRFHASARHGILLSTLIAAVALPLVDMLAEFQSGTLFAAGSSFGALTVAEPLMTAALIGCAIVSLALVIRLVASFAHLRRLQRSSAPADARVRNRAGDLAHELGMRAVDVRTCPTISSPIAIAFGKAAVLLPERLAVRLEGQELDFVLLHELMHLQRRDGISNLFAKVVRATMFWNPVVPYLERRITFERERACDEGVVAAFGQAERYARCLAAIMLWSTSPSTATPLAKSAAQLLKRIDVLLSARAENICMPRVAPLAAAVSIAAALAFAIAQPRIITVKLPVAPMQTVTSTTISRVAPVVPAAFGTFADFTPQVTSSRSFALNF